jgi:hypothetical protein
MKFKHTRLLSFLLTMSPIISFATETNYEKAETMKNKSVDSVKNTYRNTKDKVCEMVNGELKCIAKKINNKARSASDKAKTDIKELQNKID